MAVTPRQAVSVTTSATRLDSDEGSSTAGQRTPGDRALLVAQGSGTLVLGGDNTVTANNGCRVPVVAGTTISIDLDQGEQLWGIVASSTLSVDVLMAGA